MAQREEELRGQLAENEQEEEECRTREQGTRAPRRDAERRRAEELRAEQLQAGQQGRAQRLAEETSGTTAAAASAERIPSAQCVGRSDCRAQSIAASRQTSESYLCLFSYRRVIPTTTLATHRPAVHAQHNTQPDPQSHTPLTTPEPSAARHVARRKPRALHYPAA